MTERPWSLRTGHDRAIVALALPALGALIADPLLTLADTAFVGRLGGDALGALGVAGAVFAVAFFAFNFLEYATTSLVAAAVGAGDRPAAGRWSLTALVTAAAGGTIVAAGLILLTGPILTAMGAGGEWRSEAATYVGIRALAAPAVLVVRAGHGIFRGYQDTRTPLAVTAGLNVVNLVLDPLLIFGAGWGIAGAAWATVVAQWLGAGGFLWLLLRARRAELGIELRGLRLSEVRPFLAAGRDIGIRTVSLLAVFTYATRVATGIGRPSPTAVAAHQVLFQVWLFLALTVDALAVAAQALIGRSRGAGDHVGAAAVADRLVVVGAALGVALAGALAAVAPWLPNWFTSEPGVAAAIRDVYWFLVAAMPLAAVVFVWDGVFLGLADFRFLAAAMFGAGSAAIGFLSLVLPLGWGLAGVWWGLTLAMSLRLVTLAWRRWSRSGPLLAPR